MFASVFAAAAALAASSVILPASPEGLGVGDIDGDARNELVVLLVWPSWSSIAVNTSPEPNVYEIEVRPAIEDRRELWAFSVEGGQLKTIAAPLRVGREVVAIAPLEPLGPVVVLDDDGVSRVVLDLTTPDQPTLKLERVATLRPLIGGLASPLGNFPLLARFAPDKPPKIVVPTSRGLTLIEESGKQLDVDSPFREVRSGERGWIQIRLPRREDVDKDGVLDLLYIDWTEFKAALRRGAPDGSYAAPVVWDLRPLVQPETPGVPRSGEGGEDDEDAEAGSASGPRRELIDVVDSDGDGVLEAVVNVQQFEGEGIKQGMKLVRGVPGEYMSFPLRPDGAVAAEPSGRIQITGHTVDFDHPDGWMSPFRDLDGDGQPELLTMTIKLGYLAIAKAVVTKKVKVGIVLHVHKRESGVWREVADAAPKFEFTADLSDLDASRFWRMPGDLDADGRADMVQVAGREIQVHGGLAGARFAERPTQTVRLEDKIRSFFGLVFVDIDGDRKKEMIAFEEQPEQKDQPSRPVRMELRALEAPK